MINAAICVGEFCAYSMASDAISTGFNNVWGNTAESVGNYIPGSDYVPETIAKMPKNMAKRSVKRYVLKTGLPAVMTALTQQAQAVGAAKLAVIAAATLSSNPLLLGATCGALGFGVAITTAVAYKFIKNRREKAAKKASFGPSEQALHTTKPSPGKIKRLGKASTRTKTKINTLDSMQLRATDPNLFTMKSEFQAQQPQYVYVY